MTNVFELSDQLIEHGITRIQVARMAGRSLGHVCMVLNGQRKISKYLAEVLSDLIEESEREMNKYRNHFMKGLCKRAGIKPFGFHALRRYVASVLADTHTTMAAIAAKLIEQIACG
jgi:integrase